MFVDLKKNDGGYRGVRTEKSISLLVQNAIARYTHAKYRVTVNELPFESTGDVAIYSDSQLVLDLYLPPLKMELYPNELYIFFHVVKPWPVMGEYRELLKIVPLKQDEDDENITVDFHRPEYRSLSELHPRLSKGVSSKPSGKMILGPDFCFSS